MCIFLCEPEAARPVFSPICTPSSALWISLEQPDRRLVFSFQKLLLPVVLKLRYEHFINLFLLSAAALNRAITVLHEWTIDEALHEVTTCRNQSNMVTFTSP